MTIQEILTAHIRIDAYEGPATCTCEEWESRRIGINSLDQHRSHLAEVLDTHMQERKAEAWEEGADAVALRHNIYGAFLEYEDNPYEETE